MIKRAVKTYIGEVVGVCKGEVVVGVCHEDHRPALRVRNALLRPRRVALPPLRFEDGVLV